MTSTQPPYSAGEPTGPIPADLFPHSFQAAARLLCLLLALTLVSACSTTRNTAGGQDAPDRETQGQTADASGEEEDGYESVITDEAVSDEGLFTVHRVDDSFYYEIPDSLLGREILLISRVAQVPTDFFGFNSAGSSTGEQVFTLEKRGDKIQMRVRNYDNFAPDSAAIKFSVEANNFEPVVSAWDIEAIGPDSTTSVIEVTDFFTSDVPAISGLADYLRTMYQVRRVDGNRSYIESMKSFPENVETRHVLTYEAVNPPSEVQTNSLSLLMNQSMVLLPEEPMRPRYADDRVGYFSVSRINYGLNEQKAATQEFIRRWRMEPKDPEAYARGELVEPVEPIVYYLDPGTPERFRPYIIQGIEDWQEAFEAAGFKNAIIAKEPPTPEEDPDWNPEDVRYSVVRYVASTIRNAVGPSVSDPRTGEIIESDIIWYHNHLRSYRNRLMIETGAANPDARSLMLDEDLIGETMRRVISHEVGHAIGLPHNMQSSSAYPVDSLRSGSFTQEYGIATTIMEYARQNYIAQPGDENIRFIRKIGPYDKYSVNWGYRVIPEADTPEEEKPILDSWITEKEGDPVYRFGSAGGYDPSIQTEDLSDDPVQASTYGMMNLKRVVPNLIEWTSTPGESYDDLEEIYGELIGQWSRYVNHVITNIGGVYTYPKATDQEGPVYEPVPEDYQRKAMAFLNDNAFTTPEWLLDEDILRRIEHAGALERIGQLQGSHLRRVMDTDVMLRLIEAEGFSDGDTYTVSEMLGELRSGVWSEIYENENTDTYRRNLQRIYLDHIESLLNGEENDDVSHTDIQALLKEELRTLRGDVDDALPGASGLHRAHLVDVTERIDGMLDSD
ncbi:MAG: zinc-dependent metalloprotease [Balneolaceae bacterium]|nr:zinc-dependent metalloprotease [Balneolaceae bacterium]